MNEVIRKSTILRKVQRGIRNKKCRIFCVTREKRKHKNYATPEPPRRWEKSVRWEKDKRKDGSPLCGEPSFCYLVLFYVSYQLLHEGHVIQCEFAVVHHCHEVDLGKIIIGIVCKIDVHRLGDCSTFCGVVVLKRSGLTVLV